MPAMPAGSIPPTSTMTTSPQRRSRRKHKKDSFMLFEEAIISHDASAEDLSRHSVAERPESPDDNDNDPLYRHVIMMPLLSVSFILSLFLVERSERARRTSEHPSQNQSFWATFSLQNWLDPEPYQDPNDTTWQETDGGDSSGTQHQGQVPHPKRKQWFVRKKAVQVGKMSITEAFDLSGTVMIMLLVLACIVLFGVGWGGMKAYHGLMARFKS